MFTIAFRLVYRFYIKPPKLIIMSDLNYSVNIGDMRAPYKSEHNVFTEDQITEKEPFKLFKSWYNEACSCSSIKEPRAMCLATCTRSGIPSARIVILREYDEYGFKFFTNYCSKKGIELSENPNAALVFYWEALRKSIRVEGTVEKISENESISFFKSRPKEYQIDAAYSDQSKPISDREALNIKMNKFKADYEDSDDIPKPQNWGGYVLKPTSIEFWQGQSNRLHDRIRFRIPSEDEKVDNNLLHQGENGWVYERLQP